VTVDRFGFVSVHGINGKQANCRKSVQILDCLTWVWDGEKCERGGNRFLHELMSALQLGNLKKSFA
jgi:hypothetical protein